MTDRKIRKKDCVRLSNKIIERCQLALPAVTHVGDIRSSLFISLLEVLTHQLPPGIISNPTTPSDEVHNVQTIINHLALDLINVNLSHISGAQVISGDARAIYNLLEIFCGLHKYHSSHEIDKWNLEESLTETEEELSSTGSSTPSSSQSREQQEQEQEQDEEAALAAATAPPAGTSPAENSEKPAVTPSRRSSAGVRSSASADSRPSSSTRPAPGSTLASGGASPSRRRSTEGRRAQRPAVTPSSGSGPPTREDASPSVGTSASGASAAAVSFPESQYSLELELPISQSGGREPRPPKTAPHAELVSSPASVDSPPSDAISVGGLSSSPQQTQEDEQTEADGQTMADEQTSEGLTETDSRGADSGAAEIARSSESAARDTPTTETETEGTPETERETTEETEETPHEPHRFEFLEEQTPSDEDATELDDEDISRQLSREMQQMATSSGPEQTSSDGEKKQRRKTTTGPCTSSETAAGASSRSRPSGSAPCRSGAAAAAAGAAGRRRRSSDRSSASDPGVTGKRPLRRRLLTRNIETIAEIHESGGERAITRTTKERAGDRLCKETVQREVRRKVHSAPQPSTRPKSFSRQSSRRSDYSDGVLRWLEAQGDNTNIRVEGQETDVFEFLRRGFPYVRVSEETKRKLMSQYRHQMKYILHLVEPTETRKFKLRRKDVLRRQALLTDIIRQHQQHDQRFRRLQNTRLQAIRERNAPRDAKISCLRAERFVDSFKQQFESRMALNKSREELLMKAVFEEMLEIQRRRLRAVRTLEKRAIREFYDSDGYTSELNRMHQRYEANFRDLAQMLAREKADLQLSQKEQLRLADRIRREFRAYMEADVRSLNDKLVTSWQPQYRELDADRIRSDLYEANWKFCVT